MKMKTDHLLAHEQIRRKKMENFFVLAIKYENWNAHLWFHLFWQFINWLKCSADDYWYGTNNKQKWTQSYSSTKKNNVHTRWCNIMTAFFSPKRKQNGMLKSMYHWKTIKEIYK